MINMIKNFIKGGGWRVLIEYIGTTIFMVCASFFLHKEAFKALILVLCAYIFIWFMHLFYFDSITTKIKEFMSTAGLAAVVTIIVVVLRNFLKKDFVETVTQIATGVLLALIVFELTHYVKNNTTGKGMSYIKDAKFPAVPRIICKVSWLLCRIFVVFGTLFTIIKVEDLSGIIIAGCVIWGLFQMLVRIFWFNYFESDDVDADQDTESSVNGINDGNAVNNSGAISGRKVESLVKEIAKRWSGREDPLLMLSGSESVRYNVSVDVIGDSINYTIDGKLTGVREGNIQSARIHSESKMSNAANKIIEETKRELSKYRLPYSSYDVNVKQGYIKEA